MEFYIHVNTFWEVFQSFSRNIFLFTGNVTLVHIMLPYSICSTVDFPFSEEGIFRSDFNQRRTDIFPALPLINRSLWSPSQRDLHPQLPGSSPLRQQNALSQGQRSSCQERWSDGLSLHGEKCDQCLHGKPPQSFITNAPRSISSTPGASGLWLPFIGRSVVRDRENAKSDRGNLIAII